MIFTSSSQQETEKIAYEFAKKLKPNDIVAFVGDLGAGKTVFVRAMAAALGITGYVTSPTFTIVSEYKGDIPLYHFDMYRITDADSLYDVGYYDYLEAGGICAIEWSENITPFLPDSYYLVTIEKQHEDNRIITIERQGK